MEVSRRNVLAGLAAAGLAHGLPFASASATQPAQDAWAALFNEALARNPMLLGWKGVDGAPLDTPELTISGKIPTALEGRFYRNGPAAHERFGARYRHWFDADGMIQEFTLHNGRVGHRGRMIETPKRRQETAAGKRLFSGFGTHVSGGPAVRGPDALNPANISVLDHGGELMALWEAGSPTVLDRKSLAATGFKQWQPDLKGAPFTAHPKIDPDGTMWAFGYSAIPKPALLLYHISASGKLQSVALAEVDHVGIPHDFVVTERHIVIILPPLALDGDELRTQETAFADALKWRPELGARVLIAEKSDLSRQRWTQLPAGFFFHHGNAWEEADGTIRLDLCWSDDPRQLFGQLRTVMRGDMAPGKSATPRYANVVLRPGLDGEITLSDDIMEFTKVAPKVVGKQNRYVYGLTGDANALWPFDSLAKRALDTGETETFQFASHIIPEEHVFVPRMPNGAEDDGWLIGTHLDTEAGVTRLGVFDAKAISAGPLAVASLGYPLPLGFHGQFSSAR